MARRDQPYLPLYVQDFLTDEKLIECSAESTGVYIRLLCIMHKSQEYGKILLRQKDRQTERQISNFAAKLAKQMPYDIAIISRSLEELVAEGVLTIDGDTLFQKRMVKDGELSDKRSFSGRKGAESTNGRNHENPAFAAAKRPAKVSANSENENDNDIDPKNESVKERDRGEGCQGEGEGSAPGGENDPLCDPELARVMSHYLDTIDSTPSTTCTQEIIAYTERFGADIMIHAIERGRDQLKGRTSWVYIRGILRSYAKDNVQTLGDVFRQEQEFDEAMDRKGGRRDRAAPVSEGAMGDLQQLHEYFDKGDGS